MASNTAKLLCYNKGCGQEYEETNNHADACLHHPGTPVFHDAYKGWSCCNKRCTDFTEFLNIKGCCRSYHSNVKPPEPEKTKVDNSKKNEIIVCEVPQRKVAPLPRPSEDGEMVSLPVSVAPSLKQMLEKLSLEAKEATNSLNTATDQIVPGTACKNGGCKVTYANEHSNAETCTYHPGTPIFHEGLKYWSCCKRKTTDFNNFLDQEGCTSGVHVWTKKDNQQKVSCRYDWHQTGGFVYISIYAKGAKPDVSCVKANPVKLKICIFFGQDSIFETEFVLKGVIDVEKSLVNMASTKVEIKLKKAEPFSWDKLYNPLPVKSIQNDDEVSLKDVMNNPALPQPLQQPQLREADEPDDEDIDECISNL